MEDHDVVRNKPNPVHQHDVYFSLFSGAIAGIVAKTCVAPAERIKMSFQVSSEPFSLRKALNTGQRMVQSGGVLSLWKGHSTTVLRVGPYAGISYMAHDYSENIFKSTHNSNTIPAMYKFLAGSIGGFCGTVMTYPLDVLRVRLALGGTWKSAIAQKGYFQGILPTILGIVPYAGTAWLTKQTLLELYTSVESRSPLVVESLIINTIAGLFGQLVTYPLDVVRRRMQVAVGVDGVVPGFLEVVRHLIGSEGARGLGKGFSMNIIKGPISMSISLTVFDILKRFESRGRIPDS